MGQAGWPRVVVVTDRRRLTRACGLPPDGWPDLLTEQVRGAVAGGADLIQVREPDLDAGPLSQFLRGLFQNEPASQDRIVVNDRIDVALAVGARGVHLRERSMGIGAAARLAPAESWLIGRSVHDVGGASASRRASYLMAGTVQPTPSKPDTSGVIGWDGLERIAAAASGVPVVAIGGLSRDSVPAVLRAGAAGIAAIGWFIPDRRETKLAEFVLQRVAELRFVFDSHAGVSYTRGVGR